MEAKAPGILLFNLQLAVQTEVKKRLSARLRVPQNRFVRRFRLTKASEIQDAIEIFVGTWRLDPANIGAKQNNGGVRAANRSYKGAFLKRVYGKHDGIWIRSGSSRFIQKLYPGKAIGPPGARRGRFPVVQAMIPIYNEVEKAFTDYEPEMQDFFIKRFSHEIDYLVNKQ